MKLRSRARPTRVTCHDGHAIGLDIGASAVRATVLTVKDAAAGQIVVQAMAGLPLAPGTIEDGVVVDGPALTTALEQLWRQLGVKCRNVVLGVANPQVLVRDLQVPDLDPAQRARALPFQAREAIAVPIEEMVLDFAPLGPADPDTHLIDGLLVASPRPPVTALIQAVEAAGLTVVRVDLASLAVLRSVADSNHGVEAVVDLGADLTTLAVHERGKPRLVRTVARGGHDLTISLSERLSMSLSDAEDAKRRGGIVGVDEVGTLLRQLVNPLIGEIRSSLNYYRSSGTGQIDQVTLTGGGAAMPGFAEQLATVLDLPVHVANPAHLLSQPAKRKSGASDPRWVSALSVGLAIGAAA